MFSGIERNSRNVNGLKIGNCDFPIFHIAFCGLSMFSKLKHRKISILMRFLTAITNFIDYSVIRPYSSVISISWKLRFFFSHDWISITIFNMRWNRTWKHLKCESYILWSSWNDFIGTFLNLATESLKARNGW